jgi:hypothetical protein
MHIRPPVCATGLAILAAVFALPGQTLNNDTLHGFCGTSATASTCMDTGVITPTTSLASFGFTRSPDTNNGLDTPSIWLVFLIPNEQAAQTISVSQTTASASTMTLSSVGDWTSGSLQGFLLATLGLQQANGGGPTNPLNALLGQTNTYDPAATGYDVYQANFGSVNFATADPHYTTGYTAPVGTVVLAYIVDGANTFSGMITDGTASSSALLLTSSVPEPATFVMLGSVLLLVAGIARKRCAAALR